MIPRSKWMALNSQLGFNLNLIFESHNPILLNQHVLGFCKLRTRKGYASYNLILSHDRNENSNKTMVMFEWAYTAHCRINDCSTLFTRKFLQRFQDPNGWLWTLNWVLIWTIFLNPITPLLNQHVLGFCKLRTRKGYASYNLILSHDKNENSNKTMVMFEWAYIAHYRINDCSTLFTKKFLQLAISSSFPVKFSRPLRYVTLLSHEATIFHRSA